MIGRASGRARLLAALVLTTGLGASACVDVCVLSGSPCDSAADCGEGEVCRLRRAFDVPCLFAAGTCEAGDCGSVDDCAESQCCHPDSNSCVDEQGYEGNCGDRTCRSCPETSWFPDLWPDGGGPLPVCMEDDDCDLDERCAYDDCRKICSDDYECPGAECFTDHCTELYGSACEESRDCGGANCTDLNSAGTRRDGYCTGFCSEYTPCPGTMTCVDNQCRLP